MRPIFPITIVVALLAGCQASVPFSHQVVPVIPDGLKVKGAHAKAYAVNDAGHVVGIYSPSAPRTGDQIFVLADGRLIRQDYPCNGYLYANIITNTGLIAGHCQSSGTGGVRSFVLSYRQAGTLQEVRPAWPTQGYFISGMNDRGDAIGWAPEEAYRREPADTLGFVYVSGKLDVIRTSNAPPMKRFSNAVLNASGLVIGGERDRMPAGPDRYIEYRYFVFANGRFAELPSDVPGMVKAANRKGHVAIARQGRSFGIQEDAYRDIVCGKAWCDVNDINDRGWVVGNRHTDYPIPPLGAAIGDTFLWANDRFYSIDGSVGMKVDPESPLKLSNEGHILFHSGGWPYLLAPQGRQGATAPAR